ARALRGEQGDDAVEDRGVDVAPAEEVVAVVADDAEQAALGLEERGVEGAAAEVVDEPVAGAVVAREAGGERGGDGLLQELDALEAGEARGLGGRGALRQLE